MKTTAEMIEVMQAFERGEKVEYQPSGCLSWILITSPNPVWNNVHFDYRIKREPRVIWVNEYLYGGYAYSSKEEASERAVGGNAIRSCIKYVEEIE